MSGSWRALRARLARLDGVRADQELQRELLRASVDLADLDAETWEALAILRHVIRPALDAPEAPEGGVSDAEWAALERLREAAKTARS